MQEKLFSEEPAQQIINPKKEVKFKAPENISLGTYYASSSGQIVYTLHYVFEEFIDESAVVTLLIRTGRKNQHKYINTDVNQFSQYIEQGKLKRMD